MKLRIWLLLFCCLVSDGVLAQTSNAIESDLLRSFKKIDYWDEKSRADTTGNIALEDSLSDANASFAKKLKYISEKYPSTITQKFNALTSDNLDISTSDDGQFRIYSWDTRTGGTMHFFENLFQYKSGTKISSILDTPKTEGDNRPSFYKLYTFVVNKKTYYLAVWLDIGSTLVGANGIQIYTIENSRLNDNIKLIKTQSGLHSQLYYEYDNGWDESFDISFDTKTQTIRLPLISDNGRISHKFITYKFTGKYFEKVKS